jgi:hypothetical protein
LEAGLQESVSSADKKVTLLKINQKEDKELELEFKIELTVTCHPSKSACGVDERKVATEKAFKSEMATLTAAATNGEMAQNMVKAADDVLAEATSENADISVLTFLTETKIAAEKITATVEPEEFDFDEMVVEEEAKEEEKPAADDDAGMNVPLIAGGALAVVIVGGAIGFAMTRKGKEAGPTKDGKAGDMLELGPMSDDKFTGSNPLRDDDASEKKTAEIKGAY